MVILGFDKEKELRNKTTDFLKTLRNRTELLWLKDNADSIITEELARRKNKLYDNYNFTYVFHRQELRLVDLAAEDYFPCDFLDFGFLFFSRSNYLSVDRIYFLCPVVLPTDKRFFLQMMNRILTDQEKQENQIYVENIKRWLDQDDFEENIPFGVNKKEYMNGLYQLAVRVMMTYLEPITFNGSGDLENFKPKEIWVGVVDGKLHFATKQTPRFIKMWKNIQNITLT